MSVAAATLAADLPPLYDPSPDRAATAMFARILEVHHVLFVIAHYGQHLYRTLQGRAAAPGFATLAQCFGTAQVNTILLQLYRGIMRCHALDRLLRDRVKRGHELCILAPRGPRKPPAAAAAQPAATPPPATPHDAAAAQPAAAAPTARQTAALARRLAAAPAPTLATLPTQEQIDAEVRRMPIGRTLVLICRDLGVAPALCDGPFWHRVFQAIRCYGGSLAQLMLELRRREREFAVQELDHRPDLAWPEQTREGIRRVLGFRIGEPPVDPTRLSCKPDSILPRTAATPTPATTPDAPPTAAATGPP